MELRKLDTKFSPGKLMDQYVADNPPYGAVFSYYLPEENLLLKKQRQKADKELADTDRLPCSSRSRNSTAQRLNIRRASALLVTLLVR